MRCGEDVGLPVDGFVPDLATEFGREFGIELKNSMLVRLRFHRVRRDVKLKLKLISVTCDLVYQCKAENFELRPAVLSHVIAASPLRRPDCLHCS